MRITPNPNPIEGPYNAPPPKPNWGDRAVCFAAFVIFVWFVLSGMFP